MKMSTLGRFLLLIVFLLVVEIQENTACFCIPVHPQKNICDGDYVIRAKVTDKYVVSDPGVGPHDYDKYTLDIQKVFWSTPAFDNAPQKNILMFISGSSCILFLEKGRTYILAGSVQNSHLSVPTCDSYIRDNANMKKIERKLLKKYIKNCNCQINFCINANTCANPTAPCTHIFRPQSYWCYSRHSYCTFRKGKCMWKNNKQLKKCLANN